MWDWSRAGSRALSCWPHLWKVCSSHVGERVCQHISKPWCPLCIGAVVKVNEANRKPWVSDQKNKNQLELMDSSPPGKSFPLHETAQGWERWPHSKPNPCLGRRNGDKEFWRGWLPVNKARILHKTWLKFVPCGGWMRYVLRSHRHISSWSPNSATVSSD